MLSTPFLTGTVQVVALLYKRAGNLLRKYTVLSHPDSLVRKLTSLCLG
jgi:hypothetical protein